MFLYLPRVCKVVHLIFLFTFGGMIRAQKIIKHKKKTFKQKKKNEKITTSKQHLKQGTSPVGPRSFFFSNSFSFSSNSILSFSLNFSNSFFLLVFFFSSFSFSFNSSFSLFWIGILPLTKSSGLLYGRIFPS